MGDAPALILVLVFLIGRASPASRGFGLPRRGDALVALGAFGALVVIAGATGLAASALPGVEVATGVEPPRTALGWIVVVFSCVITGYLEEGFFRAYILTRLDDVGVVGPRAILASSLLFALCHLYEGPWGVVNAALAAVALSVAFLARRSLHGPAWAHGAYNALVYLWALWNWSL